MSIIKYASNPVISICDIKPSRKDFEVIGVFNPGAIKVGDETILMLRVAEKPINNDHRKYFCPVYNVDTGKVMIKSFSKDDKSCDFSDPRVILTQEQNYLTSMSHLRLAKSKDGYHFTIEDEPSVFPSCSYEAFGVEDPRITKIDQSYYISYSCASNAGIITYLASTDDFKEFNRKGIIFHPDNKDVAIFPEKVNGKYYSLHRPSCSFYGKPDIWIAESPDLMCWGNHKQVATVRKGNWDSARIGAGAIPFRTEYGWLEIYHGATEENRYCLGAILFDLNEPWKILARSEKPLVQPEEDYEVNGFFGNVVFSCGAINDNDNVRIYYGAADESVACVDMTIDDIMSNLNYKCI